MGCFRKNFLSHQHLTLVRTWLLETLNEFINLLLSAPPFHPRACHTPKSDCGAPPGPACQGSQSPAALPSRPQGTEFYRGCFNNRYSTVVFCGFGAGAPPKPGEPRQSASHHSVTLHRAFSCAGVLTATMITGARGPTLRTALLNPRAGCGPREPGGGLGRWVGPPNRATSGVVAPISDNVFARELATVRGGLALAGILAAIVAWGPTIGVWPVSASTCYTCTCLLAGAAGGHLMTQPGPLHAGSAPSITVRLYSAMTCAATST